MKLQYIKTNVNHYILFKPTEEAKEIYRQFLSDLLKDNAPEIKRELSVDENGFSRMQLWDFMKTFGEYFGLGRECIISTEIFIQCPTPIEYRECT